MKPLITLAAAVLFLSASTTFAQKVKVDVDSTVNFSHFKTFGFDKGPIARNPIISDQIVKAVEAELTARGLTKSDNPDLKVAVMAAAGMDLQAVGPTWNNVNYAVWGGYRNPAALMNVQTGTLLIDLLDTKNNSSVFRGVAKETLNRSVSADQVADAKSVEKLIQKAVVKMFKKYPGTKAG